MQVVWHLKMPYISKLIYIFEYFTTISPSAIRLYVLVILSLLWADNSLERTLLSGLISVTCAWILLRWMFFQLKCQLCHTPTVNSAGGGQVEVRGLFGWQLYSLSDPWPRASERVNIFAAFRQGKEKCKTKLKPNRKRTQKWLRGKK